MVIRLLYYLRILCLFGLGLDFRLGVFKLWVIFSLGLLGKKYLY